MVGTVGGLALTSMMMIPRESPLVRLPTQDMPSVALMKLRHTDNFRERDRSTASPGFPLDVTLVAALYGSPGLMAVTGPHIYSLTTPAQSRFYFRDGTDPLGTLVTSELRVSIKTGLAESPLELWLPVVKHANTVGAQTTGSPLRPLMMDGSQAWFFLQRNEVLTLYARATSQGTAGDGVLLYTYFMWVGGAEGKVTVANGRLGVKNDNVAVSTVIGPTTHEPGWYAIELDRFDVTGGNFEAFFVQLDTRLTDSAVACWNLIYLPELLEDTVAANSARRTAASLLITNASAALVAQGSVIAARMEGAEPFTTPFLNYSSQLETASNRYVGKAEKGVFTYAEFAAEDELFRECANNFGNPIFHTGRSALVPYISFSNANVVSSPNSYIVTMDTVLEFRTTSQRHVVGVSQYSYNDLLESRRLNNSTEWFYENPLHWRDITNFARAAWGLTRSNAVRIGTGLSAVFPEAAGAIMPIARILQR